MQRKNRLGAYMRMLALCLLLFACASPGTAPRKESISKYSPQQLIKTDANRFAETNQRRIFISLRLLAEKLYRRNPQEWRKSSNSLEEALARIFDEDHTWRFDDLGFQRDTDAIMLSMHPEYQGDRVMAFIVGMASMVQTAYGNREEFFMFDGLDAQFLYNAARNTEIAAWKLGTTRDEEGRILLLSNEMGEVTNLSFEREFGKIIGMLDTMSDVVAEETQRTVVRVVQNLATAVFLPVY